MKNFELNEKYDSIISSFSNLNKKDLIEKLNEMLPLIWIHEYKIEKKFNTDVYCISFDTFNYIFDNFASKVFEPRLIVAFGLSNPKKGKRDDYRLKKWIGDTEKIFGKEWDKGHFIANSIGGKIDGFELNIFIQKREINRGWSKSGKIFRKMEKYCYSNKNTFCFNRPIYTDASSKPSFFEFGYLNYENKIISKIYNNI